MQTVYELFEQELKTMLNCEAKLVTALREMASECKRDDLQDAFEHHRKQTEVHATRLEQILKQLGSQAEQGKCKGIEGLVLEKADFLKENPSAELLQVFNVDAAIKAERYEQSAYESLIRMAEDLELNQAVHLLKQNLNEEFEALSKMLKFADDLDAGEIGIMRLPQNREKKIA